MLDIREDVLQQVISLTIIYSKVTVTQAIKGLTVKGIGGNSEGVRIAQGVEQDFFANLDPLLNFGNA